MDKEPIFDIAHLGHIEMLTPTFDKSLRFFVDILGMTVSGEKGDSVYLRAYDSVSEARASIGRYLAFYNERRPHSSLDGRTPDEAYFGIKETAMAA